METPQQFQNRVHTYNRNSICFGEPLQTNPNLCQKIGEFGNILPFYGNTIVFLLPDAVKAQIQHIQHELYKSCGEFLAEPLSADTFHITLHDLVNGVPSLELEQQIQQTQQKALHTLYQCTQSGFDIHMTSSVLFQMVHTSIVLGFEPVTETDCQTLMQCYEQFQSVVPLAYPLTPHVTVAYFRPCRIEPDALYHIQQVIDWANTQEQIPLTLSSQQLVYQEFDSMNQYHTKME